MILSTPRLRLEPYQDSHFEGLLALNSDPVVMRFIERPDTADDVQAQIRTATKLWERLGHSRWSFIDRETQQLVGAGDIQHIDEDEANPLEVGWRLPPEHWGKGFATEAGHAMLRFAFDRLRVPEVYAVADPENYASVRVMQRLGMRYVGLLSFGDPTDVAYVEERG